MANVNFPHGLRPCMRTESGGFPAVEPYSKAVGYAYAIYQWDPVTLLDGVLNGPANGITAGTTRYRGVALNWSLASVAATMLIMNQKDAIYEAQDDATGTTSATNGPGFNANLTTTAGDSTLNRSKVQISATSIATTSSLDVGLLRLLLDPTNAYGNYSRFELMFNKFLTNPEVTQT